MREHLSAEICRFSRDWFFEQFLQFGRTISAMSVRFNLNTWNEVYLSRTNSGRWLTNAMSQYQFLHAEKFYTSFLRIKEFELSLKVSIDDEFLQLRNLNLTENPEPKTQFQYLTHVSPARGTSWGCYRGKDFRRPLRNLAVFAYSEWTWKTHLHCWFKSFRCEPIEHFNQEDISGFPDLQTHSEPLVESQSDYDRSNEWIGRAIVQNDQQELGAKEAIPKTFFIRFRTALCEVAEEVCSPQTNGAPF